MADLDELSRDELVALVRQLVERVAELEREIERLRKDPPAGTARAVPSFVKPNRPARPKKPKKKRPHSYVRHREEPTQIIEHAVEQCPDCGRRLSGGWVHRVRQVIEIPAVRYEVVEHRFLRRRCGVCGKNHVASRDLSGLALGQARIGVKLMSLIAYLRESCRIPKRTIKALLQSMFGLKLSLGEISEALHAVARHGRALYASLLESVRGSPFVQADETGWREDGLNGYLWSFSTPSVRLYHCERSRGHQVPQAILGERYPGILVSDFYGGYSYHLGLHQRCWVHYLRDLHALKEAHPKDASVACWVDEVVGLYRSAQAFQSGCRKERIRAREGFQDALAALGREYAGKQCPQRVLAQRSVRFSNELFSFVEHEGLPSENNAAERAIRPAVVARKISGGTRSAKGSQTRMILMSLFGTWALRGLHGLAECENLLTHAGVQKQYSHQP